LVEEWFFDVEIFGHSASTSHLHCGQPLKSQSD
jgi:hypothetical protein